MSDLRDHLFTALEGLSNKEKPMEVDRAQAIANGRNHRPAFCGDLHRGIHEGNSSEGGEIMTEESIKALTLWQPWASLVALCEKRFETRCWSTKYRGPLAIHAAAKTPAFLGASRHTEQFITELADVLNVRISHVPDAVANLPRASVVCIVELRSIEETSRVREILCEREKIFGNYEDGRYAWALEMLEKLETPIPAKGNRLLWTWKRK